MRKYPSLIAVAFIAAATTAQAGTVRHPRISVSPKAISAQLFDACRPLAPTANSKPEQAQGSSAEIDACTSAVWHQTAEYGRRVMLALEHLPSAGPQANFQRAVMLSTLKKDCATKDLSAQAIKMCLSSVSLTQARFPTHAYNGHIQDMLYHTAVFLGEIQSRLAVR